jgi:CRISPR type IV-associated protein Csf1
MSMSTAISPSAVYRAAAKLTPTGNDIVPSDTHCVMCAAKLAAGTKANRLIFKGKDITFDDAFNNKLDLRAMTGSHVCGDCSVLWSKDWMQKYSKSFACSEGVFSLAKNEDIAALALNPPSPPFVAIFSTKQQQHMIWRTPVSYSKDYFFVRVDGDVLSINRPKLLAAWETYRRIEQIMAEVKPEGKARNLKPPAAMFDRELASSRMGMVRADVEELLKQTGNAALIAQLHALSAGEWWVLNALRFINAAQPPGWRNAMAQAESASAEEEVS